MKPNEVAKVDEIVEQLRSQLNAALYDIGFFEGTVGNPNVSSKISGSFSGHALDIGIRAVAMKLVLFVSRSWDKNGNSIQSFIRLAGKSGPFIEKCRKKDHRDWPDSFLEIGKVQMKINSLARYISCFTKHDAFLAILRYRNEHLAHLLEGKSDVTKRLKREGKEVDEITYNGLLRTAHQTAEVICRIDQIWRFSITDPKETVRISRQYTEDFWEVIPVLADAERTTNRA